MPEPPMSLNREIANELKNHILKTMENGIQIRSILSEHSNKGPWTVDWEVKAAVEALSIFGSRWITEILATLYIAGPRRFNQLKNLLTGISSRTLSDKLQLLCDERLVVRNVSDGPPIKVEYALSEHGKQCGTLLSPLVAHMKFYHGSLSQS